MEEEGIAGGYKKDGREEGGGSLARDDRREKRGKIWRVEERRGRGGGVDGGKFTHCRIEMIKVTVF